MRFVGFGSAVSAVLLVTAASLSAADLNVSDNAQLAAALNTASVGDRILLAPGQYNRFSHSGLTGVTIGSQDPDNPAVVDAGGSGEVMKLSSITDVTIEHLIFQNYSANGINIDDSGNWPTGKSSGVVIQDVIVRNTTAAIGNRDGIKISGVDNFVIDRVQVINWSDGGSAIDPVGSHNGLIRNSRFVHDGVTASGIRPKGGSSDIDIFGNFLQMNGGRAIQFGGSTGADFFRFLPGESDYEADDIRAAGNTIIGAESAVSWVNIDGGIARHNFIDGPSTWVMRLLNENQGNSIVDTQNGVFADNIIRFDNGLSRIVNIGPEVLEDSFTFERNQWFNTQDPDITEGDIDLPTTEIDGIYGVDPELDPFAAIAYRTDWGIWIVNPHLSDQLITFDDFQQYSLAMPGGGATFDPLASAPFQGDWTFTPLAGGDLRVGAQDQLFLTVVAVPEPGGFAALLVAFWCFGSRRRCSGGRQRATA